MAAAFKAICLMACIAVQPIAALAQTPDYDVSRLAKGDVVRWTAHNGNTSLKMLGKRGAQYLFRFKRDATKGDPLRLSLWTRRDGQTVQIQNRHVTIRFVPHDCQFTLGTCTYTEKNSRYGNRKIIRVSAFQSGTWTYKQYWQKISPQTLMEEGSFTVDPNGLNIDRDYRIYNRNRDMTKAWTRRKK